MTYNLADGTISRSCAEDALSCSSDIKFQNGVYANDVCTFCCTGDLCNNVDLKKHHCEDLIGHDDGGAPKLFPSALFMCILIVNTLLW